MLVYSLRLLYYIFKIVFFLSKYLYFIYLVISFYVRLNKCFIFIFNLRFLYYGIILKGFLFLDFEL